ncbi:MAG: adenosylcobinamide-GDP ribazoletransferase, partial [Alphaproteobacteria bacterium]
MTEDLFSLRAWKRDVHITLGLLTRLPGGRHAMVATPPEVRRAARAMPVAGLVVGAIGAAALGTAAALGLAPALTALIGVAATILATGAFHEDGLADTVDGFGGGRGRVHKLAIMRDGHVGVFAVLALVFSIALRAGAVAALIA